jgi:hypothetical protein
MVAHVYMLDLGYQCQAPDCACVVTDEFIAEVKAQFFAALRVPPSCAPEPEKAPLGCTCGRDWPCKLHGGPPEPGATHEGRNP